MKAMLFAMALALPGLAAATVLVDPPQDTRPRDSQATAHHPLFTLKYVLRVQRADPALPQVTMEDPAPRMVLPTSTSMVTAVLGASGQDPNVIVCHAWACENVQR